LERERERERERESFLDGFRVILLSFSERDDVACARIETAVRKRRLEQ
jgi:hypothetical protein